MRPGIDAGLKAVGTTLEKAYPEFAVRNLIRADVDDYMRDDQLAHSFRIQPDSHRVALAGAAVYEKEIFLGMRNLSAEYAHVEFDAGVRTITFDNTVAPIPHAGIRGIEKIGGQWQPPADWKQEHGKTWCRDISM